MADTLETMFQNPVTALWAGQREGMENLKGQSALVLEQEAIRKAQQEYAQKQLTNPLEVEHKQWTNRGLEQGLPGITADSRKKTIDAETAAQTQKGAIAKTNSENELSLLEHNLKRNDALVDLLGKGAQGLRTTLPANRHAAAYQQLFKMGGQEAVDAWKDKLDMVSGEKLPDALDALAQHSAMGSVGMRQKLEELRIQGEKAKEVARISADASKYGADQRRETAEATAAARAEREARAKTLEDDVVRNLNAARAETDEAKRAIYYAQAAQSAKLKAELPGYGKVNSGEMAGMPNNTLSPLGPVGTPKQRSPEAQAALDLLKGSKK
jgi:hypothetical protein